MIKVLEVFWRFLVLGCISFGGPAAHIGYFRKQFVQKLQWIDESAYARLIALSQFLPGPGSSQIGFAIGLRKAGLAGGIAAFIGFTLPSFILLFILATAQISQSSEVFTGIISGLKLLAVVVVADAVYSMFNSFCKNNLSVTLMILTTVSLLLLPGIWTQMFVLITAGFIGAFYGNPAVKSSNTVGHIYKLPLLIFAILFAGTPLLAAYSEEVAIFSSFFQAGSLVFGGGHVVLPLLQQLVGDSITTDQFLLGYAAAQAVPGPMFTMATYLGAEIMPSFPLIGALIATVGVFLPGFLLVIGLQSGWESLAGRPRIAGATWGINAAVVGLLLSALYQPVFLSAVQSTLEMALVIAGFYILRSLHVPIVGLVIMFGLAGVFIL
ncbi:MAG: chromate efflux transporter [Gammaproteobacteria bacterium]|nr:chromate efflux transporter [Gammaproteobacteria bacterium]